MINRQQYFRQFLHSTAPEDWMFLQFYFQQFPAYAAHVFSCSGQFAAVEVAIHVAAVAILQVSTDNQDHTILCAPQTQ